MKKAAFRFVGFAFLALMIIGALASCKGKTRGDLPPVDEQDVYTIDALKPILGEAKEDTSGVLDVTGDESELIVSYRYFDVDLINYDDDMVKDLAPKIEKLYAKFRKLDRVVFQVTANNPQSPGEWKSFVNFAVTRKIVDKIEWSGVLTADFFQNVIDLKRFDFPGTIE